MKDEFARNWSLTILSLIICIVSIIYNVLADFNLIYIFGIITGTFLLIVANILFVVYVRRRKSKDPNHSKY